MIGLSWVLTLHIKCILYLYYTYSYNIIQDLWRLYTNSKNCEKVYKSFIFHHANRILCKLKFKYLFHCWYQLLLIRDITYPFQQTSKRKSSILLYFFFDDCYASTPPIKNWFLWLLFHLIGNTSEVVSHNSIEIWLRLSQYQNSILIFWPDILNQPIEAGYTIFIQTIKLLHTKIRQLRLSGELYLRSARHESCSDIIHTFLAQAWVPLASSRGVNIWAPVDPVNWPSDDVSLVQPNWKYLKRST